MYIQVSIMQILAFTRGAYSAHNGIRPHLYVIDFIYVIGVSTPRVSSTFSNLPNARHVSRELTRGSGVLADPDSSFSGSNTMNTFQIGQVIDHDVALTPAFTGTIKTDTCTFHFSILSLLYDYRPSKRPMFL